MPAHREIVGERAQGRCEYCLAPQGVTGYLFHIEHIYPRIKGGKDELSNYALACANCNFSKSDHLTGDDPKTGKEERLFNPRKDTWSEHFQFSRATLKITGKNSMGRATAKRLQFNSVRQVEARACWIELGAYP